MAETPEHSYLSRTFLEVLSEFSKLQLYGYREVERKKFDFACVLQRDWERPLVGQTLWKHIEGVDKDLRLLLSKSEADIWSYIVRDNIKNRSLLYEVIQDFRNTSYKDQLFKLKVFWIPHDFNADSTQAREAIRNSLMSSIVEDILLNVVFGNLTSHDIRFFLNASGIVGLNLAVLYEIATRGFVNYPDLSKRLGVSVGPLRERVLNLVGSGFLWQVGRASLYYIALKGRVFLELLHKLTMEYETRDLSSELRYILNKLNIEPELSSEVLGDSEISQLLELSIVFPGWSPQVTFTLLLQTVDAATRNWDIDLDNMSYKIHEWESNPSFRILR